MATGILLVDDSKQLGSRVREMLHEFQHCTLLGQAFNVTDGLKMLHETKPKVVILDIGFPTGSGISLIPEIKQMDHQTSVVMFTNYSHSVYRNKCNALGADYFFDKSTEFDQLMQLLEKYNNELSRSY